MADLPTGAGVRPAGYGYLTARFALAHIPNWHQSFVAASGIRRRDESGGLVRDTYTAKYWPGDSVGEHLEFALKYDGTNLALLAELFKVLDEGDLTALVRKKPQGKYVRRLWYLFESLTGRRLPLDDLKRGSYVELLDPKAYVVATPARRVRRQRISDNLLGDARFCPMVRRSEKLERYVGLDLGRRCRARREEIAETFPPGLVQRALGYLYAKETRSSFEIEHITQTGSRLERFARLLKDAEREDAVDLTRLLELQNKTVDPRFADEGLRRSQNYVGESLGFHRERVHYVSPRPEDLPSMMEGLIAAHARISESAGSAHPVIHAAAIAYGFVFLHPFEDGNGRIHRFLIHNILARRGFTPAGLILPVSAVMLRRRPDYDASLEAFSSTVMPLVEYELDDEGRMTVSNDTSSWYRYIDLTTQAEALFGFLEAAIETELIDELRFLEAYDRCKADMQKIVDMPDKKIDLFIRLCRENRGRLSARKRSSAFGFLADAEVLALENVVGENWGQ